MPRLIKEFKGKYRFLSNFYPSKITFQGIYYKTVEHYFQAHKAIRPGDHLMIVGQKSPSDAKRMGRLIRMRRDWESVKEDIMKRALELKFTLHPELAEKLLDTEDAILEEGNTWHDTYWGKDIKTGVGKNRLGFLLMNLRENLRIQKEFMKKRGDYD